MTRRCAAFQGLIVMVGLTGLARPAVADSTPTLPIVLQVPRPSVPLHLVIRARDEVTRIYKDVGVDVIWSGVTFDSNETGALPSIESGRALGLVVLPGKETDRLIIDAGALGGAAGTPEHRGRVAYVFYDRVQRIAGAYLNTSRDCAECNLDNVIVLAHVMAHEIGHLLLPYGHSATGLMRANWDATDLRRTLYGRLKFTPEQAALIRARLRGATDQPVEEPTATSVAD